ncbi:hypothetical protein [Cupriavidus sp. TMH.W2]|uniref:hypothetical protein n=1 Tax=Cupriavidus sp. TMH.W2 TaxID=3434465 RepID=UPI003D77BEC8
MTIAVFQANPFPRRTLTSEDEMSDPTQDSAPGRNEPVPSEAHPKDDSPNPVEPGRALSDPIQAATTTTTGVSLVTTIVVSTLLSAFSGLLSWHFATSSKQPTQMVALIDGAKLVEIQAKTALATPGMTPEQATTQGKEFVLRLNQALDEYTQAGVVVINSSVVLNRPGQTDITPQVAQKLGLKVE